jgi:hypothetical protein
MLVCSASGRRKVYPTCHVRCMLGRNHCDSEHDPCCESECQHPLQKLALRIACRHLSRSAHPCALEKVFWFCKLRHGMLRASRSSGASAAALLAFTFLFDCRKCLCELPPPNSLSLRQLARQLARRPVPQSKTETRFRIKAKQGCAGSACSDGLVAEASAADGGCSRRMS